MVMFYIHLIGCPYHDNTLEKVKLVDTSVLEETEENKKMFKIVMFDSQEPRVNRSQGLKKRNIQEVRPGCSAMQ